MEVSKKLIQLASNFDNFTVVFIKSYTNLQYFIEYIPTVKTRPFGFFYGKNTTLILPMTSYSDVTNKLPLLKLKPYTEFPTDKYQTSFESSLRNYFDENKMITKIAFEGNKVTYQDIELFKEYNLELIDITKDIERIRETKDNEELNKIKKSALFSNKMIFNCIKLLRLGMSEVEIDNLSIQMTKNDIHTKYPEALADFFSLTTIGLQRTLLPHTISTNTKIMNGDNLILCRQTSINGYRAQCDRTIFTKEISIREQYYYNIVLKAHQNAIQFIKPGVLAEEIDLSIRNTFKTFGVENFYLHRSGSGIGLQMAESPFLQINDKTILESGMVLIIQPALYIPNFGGYRISDTLVVTSDGCELLTNFPREIQNLTCIL